LAACGGDATNPGTVPDISGTWIGAYTNTNNPGLVAEGVLQLEQDGADVTGTLTTNVGRRADVIGEVTDLGFVATFVYTDTCAGTAETTADIVANGTRLVGNYTSSDCIGDTGGGYSLAKQ
jgi:hypothetical protein